MVVSPSAVLGARAEVKGSAAWVPVHSVHGPCGSGARLRSSTGPPHAGHPCEAFCPAQRRKRSTTERRHADHPIRRIKALADQQLRELGPVFDRMYAEGGRSSIPPERLLKGQLLIALYTVRSERQFCERLDYDLLFRFFLDMSLEEESWDATVFTKNRDRLMEHEVAKRFFEGVVRRAKGMELISKEHFTVDGTLIEAWASLKSFRRKDENPEERPPPDDPGNPSVDFHREKRSNETHESKTAPEAWLARKSKGTTARLCFSGHALMDNRSGLCVDFRIATADGYAERTEALAMLRRLRRRGYRPKTVGGDKGYDKGSFPHDDFAAK